MVNFNSETEQMCFISVVMGNIVIHVKALVPGDNNLETQNSMFLVTEGSNYILLDCMSTTFCVKTPGHKG